MSLQRRDLENPTRGTRLNSGRVSPGRRFAGLVAVFTLLFLPSMGDFNLGQSGGEALAAQVVVETGTYQATSIGTPLPPSGDGGGTLNGTVTYDPGDTCGTQPAEPSCTLDCTVFQRTVPMQRAPQSGTRGAPEAVG